jgi:hypothetical protein
MKNTDDVRIESGCYLFPIRVLKPLIISKSGIGDEDADTTPEIQSIGEQAIDLFLF